MTARRRTRTANVKTAAKKLPIGARQPFLEAFYACGVADLYEGDLAVYLEVIRDTLQRNRDAVSKALFNAVDAARVLRKAGGPAMTSRTPTRRIWPRER